MTLALWPRARKGRAVGYVSGRLPYVAQQAPAEASASEDGEVVAVTNGLLPVVHAGPAVETAESALVAYLRVYDALTEYLFPPDLIAQLEQLRVDLFDRTGAPQSDYYARVIAVGSDLLQRAQFAGDIVDGMSPAPEAAAAAYGALAEFQLALVPAVVAVQAAAESGYFGDLQGHLFHVTRELAERHRLVKAQHKKLHKRARREGYRPA